MESLALFLSDLLLFAAAIGAAVYCFILSRRLTRLNSIDKGLGGAIAVLSAQVDDLTKALDDAKAGSDASADRLGKLVDEAGALANEIEEMLVVSYDLEAAAASVKFDSARHRDFKEAEATGKAAMFRHRPTQEAAE